MERRLMVAPTARPKRMACSTAARFSTGSVPGSAMSTAEACVLGSAPKALAAAEKILLLVRSCAWVSMPTTISQAIVLPRLGGIAAALLDAVMGGECQAGQALHSGVSRGTRECQSVACW